MRFTPVGTHVELDLDMRANTLGLLSRLGADPPAARLLLTPPTGTPFGLSSCKFKLFFKIVFILKK